MDVSRILWADGAQASGFLYEAVWLVFVLYVGLVLGSFATALVYRVPRGISWVGSFRKKVKKPDDGVARSACPHCKKVLGIRDLIPVFSWLMSGGRCRYCHEKIGVRYPLIEIVTLCAVLICYLVYGVSWEGAILTLTVPFLVALFFIDWERMILPNQLVAITGFFALLFVFARFYGLGGPESAPEALRFVAYRFAAFFVYALSIYLLGWLTGLVLRKKALGMGDVKFFAVAGLWLGLEMMPVFFFMSGLFGVLLGIGWRLFAGKKGLFPFGPALIAALYVILLANGAGFDLYRIFFGFSFF